MILLFVQTQILVTKGEKKYKLKFVKLLTLIKRSKEIGTKIRALSAC